MKIYWRQFIGVVLQFTIVIFTLGSACIATNSFPDRDILVLKVDADGAEQWKIAIDSGQDDVAVSVAQTHDGGYMIAGHGGRGKAYESIPRLIRLDDRGTIIWDKTFGSNPNYATSVVPASAGGYLITLYDGPVMKLDEEGNPEWETSVEGDYILSAVQTADEGYTFVGGRGALYSNVKGDFWIVHLNKEGRIEWQKAYGGKNRENALTVARTADDGYIVGGHRYSKDSGNDIWLIRLDSEGNHQWNTTLGGVQDDYLYLVSELDGGEYSAIYSKGEGNLSGPVEVRIDSNGTPVQEQHLDVTKPILRTDRAEYVFAGFATSQGYRNFYIIKMNDRGEIVWDMTYSLNGAPGSNRVVSMVDMVEVKSIIATRDGGYLVLLNWQNYS